jgi:hypothetical protein
MGVMEKVRSIGLLKSMMHGTLFMSTFARTLWKVCCTMLSEMSLFEQMSRQRMPIGRISSRNAGGECQRRF